MKSYQREYWLLKIIEDQAKDDRIGADANHNRTEFTLL